jgi:ribosome-associated protein YbcJ (S4-like RNA binding protein)
MSIQDYLIKKKLINQGFELRSYVLMGKVQINDKVVSFDECSSLQLRHGDVIKFKTRYLVVDMRGGI